MSIVDIILGGLLLFGLYKGWRNGVFVEIASVVALIAAFYGTIHFSYITAGYLSEQLDWNETFIKISAFVITFLAILIGVNLLGKLLSKAADFAMLGFLNRIAGGIFGIVKVAIILGVLMSFLERANQPLDLLAPDAFEQSILYKPIKDSGSLIFSGILEPEFLHDKKSFL
ncbi:CvpA family protein [Robiginitalea aurantiaca]|uniref:CvpA family protein n=1 Tax=Robiginitalea aurantiaca TaxID=3056915 RepID=A0ABT7WEB6_9FLAO|nr:CvpA family protein [Robiginitalea aurantiaca]MDM9631256.1 CvpA family protein [Robiginitalea aurantiaca]